MRLARASVGALLAAVLGACPEAPQTPSLPTPKKPVAFITEAEGQVTLERDGGVPAAAGTALVEGDVVVTGLASRALLSDEAGWRLEVGEASRFRLGRSLAELTVSIGDVTFLDEEDGGAWRGASIETPFGRASMKDGATGRVRVSDGGLSIIVGIGAIEFYDTDGGTRQAGAGQRLVVGLGSIEMDEPPRAPELVVGIGSIEMDEPPVPEVLTLEVKGGAAQVKPKGAPRFLPAKKDTPLEAGAAFQVPRGARARLVGTAFVLDVQPGGGGRLESVQKLNGVSTAVLAQTRGTLTLALDGSQPAKLVLDGVGIEGVEAATAAVTHAGAQKRIEVRAGQVVVSQGGVNRTVKAGEVLTAGPGLLGEPKALEPDLTVPIGRKVRVFSARPLLVGLELPDGGAHRVQAASDADFGTLLAQGVAEKRVLVPAPLRGDVFWRILDDGGQPVAEGRARFAPDTASLRDAQAKTDTVAETGLKATIYFQREVPTLTFTFGATEGAAGYHFRVYRAGDLKAPLLEKRVKEPKATVESGQLTEGSYLWSASPLDAAGNETGGGRMNRLDVVYDNSLTTLHIASPKNGDRAGPGVVAAGVAPLGTTLAINGRPVKLDGQGRFSVPVPKDDVVVFHLKSGGSDSFWVRRLGR